MINYLIRNIAPETDNILTKEAEEKNISRNDLVNTILNSYALGREARTAGEIYSQFMKEVLMSQNTRNRELDMIVERLENIVEEITSEYDLREDQKWKI